MNSKFSYCFKQLVFTNTLLVLSLGSSNSQVVAQIVPDTTLPTNSRVTQTGNTFTIDRGTTRGSNLFHSFSEFSVPTGTQAFFNTTNDIVNIISRVTGSNLSNIDGTLSANGTANLFLINPNGIIFGPNAALNLGGSFIGSTANGIQFTNGTIYSATTPNSPPLLTINVPIGLQYGAAPQSVQVQGSTLQVNSGETLTLVGGDVNLNGGQLLAPAGQINIGSISGLGTIPLDANFGLGEISPGVPQGNITLNNSSLIQVTGASEGIEITSNNLTLNTGSQIQTLTTSPAAAGDIQINTTGNINISGFSSDGLFSSILSLSMGNNGGRGGDINLNQVGTARGNLTLSDKGLIASVTESSNNGGDINLNLNNLGLFNGGQIVSLTSGAGNSGVITVNVTDTVLISGENFAFEPSPFTDLNVFSLNELPFSTQANPNIEASTTIPHVSVERTPTQILSGSRVFSTVENGAFDFYSFSITQANSQAIFDIDFGAVGEFLDFVPGSVSAELFLFDFNTGTLLASNQGSFDPTLGAGGSTSNFDSYIATTLTQPGTYVIAVGEFDSNASGSSTFEPLIGNRIDQGDTYTLQVSLENQGRLPTPNPPNNLNPNFGASSGIFSISEAAGAGGHLTLNAGQVSLQNSGEISSVTLGSGRGADLNLTTSELLSNNALISSITRGSREAGNITITADRVKLENQGRIDASTFGGGNGGQINLTARDTVVIDSLDGEKVATGIFSEVETMAVANGGGININTPRLTVNSGKISGTVRGVGNAGNLNVTASESVVFNDSDIDFEIDTTGRGIGGNVNITAPLVSVLNGSEIEAEVDGRGEGGDVNITASQQVLIDDSELQVEIDIGGAGTGGDINIVAPVVSLTNGTVLTAQADEQTVGNGGRINIRGFEQVLIDQSQIETKIATGAVGTGGAIDIFTQQLTLSNGASLSASTEGVGDAGTINLVGTSFISVDDSSISSAVETGAIGNGGTLNLVTPQLLLSNNALISAATEVGSTGNGGNIFVDSTKVILRDGAGIGVNSEGSGVGGSIELSGEQLILDNNAFITAATASNQGGEITLNLEQLLLLRHGSNITATAGTAGAGGDGGNITINVPFIVAVSGEDSDITANAFEGNGGNIQISAKGIFGIQFRDQLTPLSDITASSKFGVSGTVTITNPEVDPASGLVELPVEVVDSSNQVITRCAAAEGNSFTIIGRGGIPEEPTATIRGQTVWQDLQDFSAEGEQPQQISQPSSPPVAVNPPSQILEATGWIVDGEGNVELVAHLPDGTLIRSGARHPECINKYITDSLHQAEN